MSARTRLTLPGLVFTVMLAGCEDPPDTLTRTDAVALLMATRHMVFDVSERVAEFVPVVDTAVTCTGGGQAKVVGTATSDIIEDTVRIEEVAVITPTGCRVGVWYTSFTVDGAPGIRREVSVEIVGHQVTIIGGRAEGTVNWQQGDRSGECAMNLVLDATVLPPPGDSGLPAGSIKGNMCGHQIELPHSVID